MWRIKPNKITSPFPVWVKVVGGFFACGLCSSVVYQSGYGWFCQNSECEKHEHLPEKESNFDNLKVQTISISGTVASGASGTYGPVNIIEWQNEGRW